jgi:hypothetical protein
MPGMGILVTASFATGVSPWLLSFAARVLLLLLVRSARRTFLRRLSRLGHAPLCFHPPPDANISADRSLGSFCLYHPRLGVSTKSHPARQPGYRQFRNPGDASVWGRLSLVTGHLSLVECK